MYFNANFNVFFKVHLLVSELYVCYVVQSIMLYGGIFAVYCESQIEHKTQAVVKDWAVVCFFHTLIFFIQLSYV